MKHFFLILLAFIPAVAALLAQPAPKKKSLELRVAATLPAIIKEASGLQSSPSGLLWTHNDDRYAILYGLDSTARIVRTIHLNHPNNGWEDLARDRHGNFYVGGFGNNRNDRKNLAIYKIPNPDAVSAQVINAEIISYRYPDQHAFPPPESHRNFDADALISRGDSLYVFTKNRTRPSTGYTKVYRVPSHPGDYEAVLYDSLFLGTGDMMAQWVTAADISPDGKTLALLSHDCLWIASGFNGNRFSSGNLVRVNLNHFSHKAGLSFVSNTRLYLVDELEFGFLGGKLYSLDLGGMIQSVPADTAHGR